MLQIREKLGKLGIKLAFIEMESKGCFIHGLETMFVNSALSEDDMKMVIYHEMKHALDHADYAFFVQGTNISNQNGVRSQRIYGQENYRR